MPTRPRRPALRAPIYRKPGSVLTACTSPRRAGEAWLDALVVRNPDALCAEVDGEVVALDPARGACYGLNRVGSRIWSLIETPMTIGRVCSALQREYVVPERQCEREVIELVEALIGEGLARIDLPSGVPRRRS
jgi:Coenzyme PQQ synthesis protein D (PqqD)